MPEFVMENRRDCVETESAFVYGFIEVLFFTETSHYTSDVWFSDETQKAIQVGLYLPNGEAARAAKYGRNNRGLNGDSPAFPRTRRHARTR